MTDDTSLTELDSTPPASPGEFALPTRLDRFLILEKLGQGGMALVFAAYDTLLDRRVAIKIVRPDRVPSQGAVTAREQLLREAQAMARLHHPNVVAVLDVGELGDRVYLALELVDGQTLKTWLRERRRSWREIVAAFVDAGRGLAAAHAAGLVHRDVKPDNILVGRDGRIRITDFGVASLHHVSSDGSDPSPASNEDTLQGLRVGTLNYMPPEQFARGVVDARADQFSFCVSLWEALFGELPFAPPPPNTGLAERVLREVPAGRTAPTWLVAALRRGLSADPRARWPSMDTLLAELARDRGRRRRVAIGAAIATLLVASIAIAFAGWTRDETAPCTDEARHLDGVWDDARAGALANAIRATGAPTAEATVQRVRGQLDRWTETWVAQRKSACEATRVHGDQSEAVLDLRMRCFDRRLVGVREVIEQLGKLDRASVTRAVEIAADLPDPRACSAEQSTATAAPPEPAMRETIAEVERALARISAIEQTGRFPDALALAVPLVDRAAATRYTAVHAEALALVGRLRVQTGDAAGGIESLRTAAVLAASVHADDVAADALLELVWATTDAGRGAEAIAVAAAVAPAVARTHDPALEALLASQIGDARALAGDLTTAATELQHALALAEAAAGPDHVRVAQVLNRLGALEDRLNQPTQARPYYERALAILEARLGSDHPSAAITRANICHLDAVADRAEEAARCYEQVIATLEVALGVDHPQVAWALNDAGLVEQARGANDRARADWLRAKAIYERTTPHHVDIAWPLANLGELAIRSGDPAGGEALCGEALRAVEQAAGPAHPMTFNPLVCIGLALAERRPAEAVAVLERALHMDEAKLDPEARGLSYFALARAWERRRDRKNAAANAREALAALDEAGAASERAEVAAWMKQHALR